MSMISLSIFLCIEESRLGTFLSFCLIHSTRFQQAHNRIHAINIHLRNQQPKIAMLEWNVFHTFVHLFYFFSVLFIFDRNEIILIAVVFFKYPLYTQQSIFYLQIIVDLFRWIFIYEMSTHIPFFFNLVLALFI